MINIFTRTKIFVVFIAVLAFGTFLFLQSASAQETLSISLSPSVFEIDATSGETIPIEVRLLNAADEDVIVSVSSADFVPDGESGSVEVLTEDEESEFSLKDWYKDDIANFELAGGKSRIVTADFVIPEDIKDQSYFGVILFEWTTPIDEEDGPTLTQSIGSLVLINIGEVDPIWRLGRFDMSPAVVQEQEEDSFDVDLNFDVAIANTGGYIFKINPVVEILENGEVIETIDLDDPKNVLPDSMRAFSFDFAETLDSNKSYEARVSATANGRADSEVEDTISIYQAPPSSILMYLAIGGGVLVLFGGVIFFLKKKNKNVKHETLPAVSDTAQQTTLTIDNSEDAIKQPNEQNPQPPVV